jgi:hypothetical protein
MSRITRGTALFLRGGLNKGLYYGHKGKGYATEVVTTAEKLPLDGFKRRLRRSVELAGRRSRIRERTASSRGKEAAAKAQGYAERVKSKDGLEREASSYKRRPRKAPGPRKWSTGSCRLCSRGRKSEDRSLD